jgi:hypothetical protein
MYLSRAFSVGSAIVSTDQISVLIDDGMPYHSALAAKEWSKSQLFTAGLLNDEARASDWMRLHLFPVVSGSVVGALELLETYFIPLRERFKGRHVACVADECSTEFLQVCNQHLYCFVLLTIMQGETSPIYRAIMYLIFQSEAHPTLPGCTSVPPSPSHSSPNDK